MEKIKPYIKPLVELVKLDTDISLYLESSPPFGPGETLPLFSQTTDYLSDNPIKT